ncbi:MAG: ThiF family adenylyltransferase [Patescibacteria group bacterium]
MIEKPTIYEEKPKFNTEVEIVNIFNDCIRELVLIDNPKLKNSISDSLVSEFVCHHNIKRVWAHYDWLDRVFCLPGEDFYVDLITSRNKNLIRQAEQVKVYNSKIGIAGMSVGSKVLDGLLRSAVGNKFVLADFDTVEVTNLNRINAGLVDYGSLKGEVAMRKSWEVNPFIDMKFFDCGVQKSNINDFVINENIDVLVDAVDDISIKIELRKYCKVNKIPVVMATDFGEEVVISIERYDISEDQELFHGVLKDEKIVDAGHLLNKQDWIRIANKIIGFEPGDRLRSSLKEVGSTLVSIPQLGTTSMVAGAVASDAVRSILLTKQICGNYLINYNSFTK